MTETRSFDLPTDPPEGTPSSICARPKVRGARQAALALSLLGLLGLADCRPNQDDSGGGFPRAETFYVAGWQWGEPASFNPLLGNPDWPVSTMNLIYETLLNYNSISGKMEPLLAESYEAHDDNVEVTLNPAARWSDGQPVTAWDVTYTFELGQRFKSLNIAPIWQYLTAVRAYDEDGSEASKEPTPGDKYPRRVVFALNRDKKNPLVVLDALQAQRIIPRHSIEPLLQQH
ncbi:MAG TPA: ABC transporter substrate-binding protein, partial [Polyangiaceae bacterium]|nr:ABC transporter substrate-binding protein [Polyangiaceae bacterium]